VHLPREKPGSKKHERRNLLNFELAQGGFQIHGSVKKGDSSSSLLFCSSWYGGGRKGVRRQSESAFEGCGGGLLLCKGSPSHGKRKKGESSFAREFKFPSHKGVQTRSGEGERLCDIKTAKSYRPRSQGEKNNNGTFPQSHGQDLGKGKKKKLSFQDERRKPVFQQGRGITAVSARKGTAVQERGGRGKDTSLRRKSGGCEGKGFLRKRGELITILLTQWKMGICKCLQGGRRAPEEWEKGNEGRVKEKKKLFAPG